MLADVDSGWALPAAPYAGPNQGAFLVPPVGAGVWIEFEAGDVSRPIWSGCWWSSSDAPKDQDGNDAAPERRILRSEQGLIVALDDQGQKIDISDSNGSNIITIDSQGGKLTVKASTKVVVEAPQIELVESSTHPVVFGDDLLQYLQQLTQLYQTHMHPGQTAAGIPVSPAPPTPPLPSPMQTMLSQKVKTG
jgi:uncharacterized protein involved in type VI secretion and phage assembly